MCGRAGPIAPSADPEASPAPTGRGKTGAKGVLSAGAKMSLPEERSESAESELAHAEVGQAATMSGACLSNAPSVRAGRASDATYPCQ